MLSAAVDLRESNLYEIGPTETAEPRRLQLIVGTAQYLERQTVAPTGSPPKYALDAAFPNPFSTGTTIRYSLPEATHIVVDVVSVAGRRVVTLIDEHVSAGHHAHVWRGRDAQNRPLPSGLYFIRLSTNGSRLLRPAVLIR